MGVAEGEGEGREEKQRGELRQRGSFELTIGFFLVSFRFLVGTRMVPFLMVALTLEELIPLIILA